MATKKTQNRTKTSSASSTKNAEMVKKPLISTARKIGIAVYFTFLATLALAFGITIWMAEVFNAPSNTNTPMTTDTQTESTTQNNDILNNQSQSPQQQDYQNNNSAPTPEITEDANQNNGQYDFYCPNGECGTTMHFNL